jgi:transforming growth factor-beta-induced protein
MSRHTQIPRTFRTLALAGALVLAGCSESSASPVDPIDPDQNDVVDTAIEAGFSTLVTAVQAAGLENVLRGSGPFTIFAPTNQAFQNLPSGVLDGLLADTDALTSVLLYHVVEGRILASDLTDGQIVTSIDGRPFRITLGSGAQVNGAGIVTTDVEATNGVIHVIDAVLIPVGDNVDTAVSAEFNTLVAAVQAAGLEDVLRGEGPFTIFAPTEEAFAALPAGTLEALLADPSALASILTYHVIPGRVFASDLQDGLQVNTVEGSPVTFSLTGSAMVNDAQITATDILTSNGVIHVIDTVLIP